MRVDPHGEGQARKSPRRRGRPPGSVSLTPQKQATILGLLQAGASDEDAAEAAGVSPRTFREWIGRGEGRSARGSTPKLRDFAREVRKAKAQARASAKVRVFQNNPAAWLDRKGYREEQAASAEEVTPEGIRDLARGLVHSMLRTDPKEIVPRCLSPRCRCLWHRERTEEELSRTAAMGLRGRARPRSSP